MRHPDPDALLDLFLSLPEERQILMEHLLSCFDCRTALASVTVACGPAGGEPEPSPSLERLWSLAQAAEEALTAKQRKDREESRQLLREVLDLPEDERLKAVRNEKRFHSAELARRLLQEGEWIGVNDLLRMEAFAALAAAIGEAIAEADPFGKQAAIAPLRVRAECLAADAQRQRGVYDKSEKWLADAAKNLSLEPLLSPARALYCRTAALLRRAQDRIDEALALLDRAAEILEGLEETGELGEVRTEQGWTLLEDAPARSIRCFEEGIEKVNSDANPLMALRARHGLALAYAELGELQEAERLLRVSKEHEVLLVDPLDRLQTAWSEARVIAKCGRDKDATDILEGVFRSLLKAGFPFEAGAVALDLAQLLGKQRSMVRHAELRKELAALVDAGTLDAGSHQTVDSALQMLAPDEEMLGINLRDHARRFLHYVHQCKMALPVLARPRPEEPEKAPAPEQSTGN